MSAGLWNTGVNRPRLPLVPERVWANALNDVPRWQPPDKPAIVIAPHPDDEVIGVGGLVWRLRRRGLPVLVLAVTDGEAAYGGLTGLGTLRRHEQEAALYHLGVHSGEILRLGMSDSNVAASERFLEEVVCSLVGENAMVLAPWSKDVHPDHEACGRVASRVAASVGAKLVSYLVWAWHHVEVPDITSQPLRRFDLDAPTQAAKSLALAKHHSQLRRRMGPPRLSETLLAPARRSYEIFITSN